jgi:tetratricopeptide (TPR) repeat protein
LGLIVGLDPGEPSFAVATFVPIPIVRRCDMSRALRITILAGSAGFGLALLIGSDLAANNRASAMQPVRYFDPVLSGTLCTADADGRRHLLSYYRKVAAATETKPFSPPAAGSEVADAGGDAPLYDDLGSLSFPITTKNPLAQRYFDQGLRLAYGFNHAEARRAFRTAQKHDPDCAMCAWGEALVLGPNINAPMETEAVAPAIAAVRKAQENVASTSAREQALIAAVAERYSADPNAERPTLDTAYAAAMERLAVRFPEDDNIQALYAEALMDLSPWDYWEAGGAKPKGRTQEIVDSLERVLARSPEHPGAIHYYIHMMEASSAPERALPYARRLAAAVPGAGHLVHMPFHIYYRVGDYKAAVAANKAAVKIDEAYIAAEKPVGIYPLAYYPHNVHSLMASAQMAGDGASAVAAAEKLARIVSADAARAVPIAQPIAVAHYYAHAQFSAPATVLALADPGEDLPFVKAMWHYARGVAYASEKNVSAARGEAAAIERLTTGDVSALASAGIPAPQVLDLAHQVVLGRIALAEGELPAARSAFEQAVAIQERLAYSEPPYWYYPVGQSLAAVLLRLGELDAAEDAFRASLARAPNNGWALYGLSEVYRRMGIGRRRGSRPTPR